MKAVNLIPVEQRGGAPVGSGRSEGAAYAAIALVLGLAVLGVLYGKAKHEVSARGSEATSLTAQAQQAQVATSQLAPYTSFVALREQRMQAVSQLVGARFDWAHVFHEFGRVLPNAVSISALSGTVGSTTGTTGTTASTPSSAGSGAASASAAVASTTPPGSVPTFTIDGCAANQAAVALTLERLRLMDGAVNVTLQSSTATPTPGGSTAATAASISGGCPASDPVFAAQITFEPLPQPAPVKATTVDASASSSTGGQR